MWIKAMAFGLLAAASLLLANPAAADSDGEPKDGFYAGLKIIGSIARAVDAEQNGSATFDVDESTKTNNALGPGILVGYQWDKGVPGSLQFELEYDYRFRFDYDNDPPILKEPVPVQQSFSANVESHIVLANINYLFDFGSSLHPYLSAGIGAAFHNTDTSFLDASGPVPLFESDQRSTAGLAYTMGAGVQWDVFNSWTLLLAYRFMNLGDIETGTFDGGRISVEAEYVSHDVMLGALFRF